MSTYANRSRLKSTPALLIVIAIACSILLNALGIFVIRLAIAYTITKKLITRISQLKSHSKLRLELTTGTR